MLYLKKNHGVIHKIELHSSLYFVSVASIHARVVYKSNYCELNKKKIIGHTQGQNVFFFFFCKLLVWMNSFVLAYCKKRYCYIHSTLPALYTQANKCCIFASISTELTIARFILNEAIN